MLKKTLTYKKNNKNCLYEVGFTDRFRFRKCGEMAEWFNAAVLKTVEGNSLPEFESLSLRQS